MHEWESVPRSTAIRKREMADGAAAIDFLALGARQYGANFGFCSLLDVVDKFDVKVTVLTSGLMAELFPETLQDAISRKHEVACHHWDQSRHPFECTNRDEERDGIVKSIDAIERATGQRPAGYKSPGPRPSANTLELCALLGFLWNGDYCDAEIPYLMDVNGKKLVSVVYVRPGYTDNDLMPLGMAGALEQLKLEFDAHSTESACHPMKFRYAMHNFTGGQPGMVQVFE